MSDVRLFHRRERSSEQSPIQLIAAALEANARDLQTAANELLQRHGPNSGAGSTPTTTGGRQP